MTLKEKLWKEAAQREQNIRLIMYELTKLGLEPKFRATTDYLLEDDSIEVTPTISIQIMDTSGFEVGEMLAPPAYKCYGVTDSVAEIVRTVKTLTKKI